MHAERLAPRFVRMGALVLLGLVLPFQAIVANETRWPDPEDLHEIKQAPGDNPWLSGDHPPTPENRTNQWEQEPETTDARFPDPDYSPYKRPEPGRRKPRGEYLPGNGMPYSVSPGTARWPAWGAGAYSPGYGYGASPWGYPPVVPPPYWDDDGTDFPFFDGAPWDFDGFPFSPFRW